jgi:uncharacterized damage-inducible protein DinB
MVDAFVGVLIAHFESVFAGPNGDYPATREALAGLTAAQAAWKPSPQANSIWLIVDHLSASKDWQVEMLETGRAAVPVWSEPSGAPADWQAALERLSQAHAGLRSALSRLSDEELLAIPSGEEKTLVELLLSTAAHEAHHGGQIDYLKGLQGAKNRPAPNSAQNE